MASPLRKWMRKEDIYDKDPEALLAEYKIENPPGDFKNLNQTHWDEIVRKGTVERFKELKDQASRSRLEKKMKKIEKAWRKESGIKSTAIKKNSKAAKPGAAKKKKQEEEKKSEAKTAVELKKYMKGQGIWMQDLHDILVESDITCPEDFAKIKSNDDYEEIYRKVRVARAADLKDASAQQRMQKLMVKFEKDWRKRTGIKKTAKTKNTDAADAKTNPKDDEANQLDGSKLKAWMMKLSVWEKTLYDELLKNDVNDGDKLAALTEDKFEEIIRVVRVTRFEELKDMESRQRLDKLLIKFEKEWRNVTGIKKTSITEQQKAADANKIKTADDDDKGGDDEE